MDAPLCAAIKQRNVILFNYDGQHRVAEPFCQGTSNAGYEVLRAYQVGGFSSSGSPEGWRLYRVDKMDGLESTDVTFSGLRPEYNPADGGMTVVHCQV